MRTQPRDAIITSLILGALLYAAPAASQPPPGPEPCSVPRFNSADGGWFWCRGWTNYDDWSSGVKIADPTNWKGVYVGLPFEAEPKSRCPSWAIEGVELLSGNLPPGLSIVGHRIVGTPTRAGTWHFIVKMKKFSCSGWALSDVTQIIHMTTEGSSVPESLR